MAEILFLVCLSLLLMGAHLVFSRIMPYLIRLPLVLVLTGILVLFIPGLVLIRLFILALVLCGILLYFYRGKQSPYFIPVIAMILVTLAGFGYPWWGEGLRTVYFSLLEGMIRQLPWISRSRVIEALYSVWVYHEYLPWILGLLVYSAGIYASYAEDNPWTVWYRHAKRLNRLWALPGLLILLVSFIFSLLKIKPGIQMVFNNLTLMAATPMMLLGVLIPIFGLMKKRWPQVLVQMILFSALVFSGSWFLIFLVLVFGIGISDSWMHYLKNA